MDVPVPADGILQPLFLRKTQRGFDLRADVGFADSAIEICHEHHCGNLLYQRAIAGLDIGQLCVAVTIFGPALIPLFWRIDDAFRLGGSVALAKDSGQALKNFLGLRGSEIGLVSRRRMSVSGAIRLFWPRKRNHSLLPEQVPSTQKRSFDLGLGTCTLNYCVRLRQLGSLFNEDCVKRRKA